MTVLESLIAKISNTLNKEFRPKATPKTASMTGVSLPIIWAAIVAQDSTSIIGRLVIGALVVSGFALHIFYLFGAENIQFRFYSMKDVAELPSLEIIKMFCWLSSAAMSALVVFGLLGFES